MHGTLIPPLCFQQIVTDWTQGLNLTFSVFIYFNYVPGIPISNIKHHLNAYGSMLVPLDIHAWLIICFFMMEEI